MAPLTPTHQRRSLSSFSSSTHGIRATLAIADTASWYCSIIIVALILFMITFREDTFNSYYDIDVEAYDDDDHNNSHDRSFFPSNRDTMKSVNLLGYRRPCDEIYVVSEGETLHTISDKCGDPYIVERNPHIHDPDDVFPGLVIKILPSPPITNNRKLLR